MVGTINPVVYRQIYPEQHTLRLWFNSVLSFLLGSTVGAGLLGYALFLTGSVFHATRWGTPCTMTLLLIMSVIYSLAELGVIRGLPIMPWRTRQVPQSWRGKLPPVTHSFIYGCCLGGVVYYGDIVVATYSVVMVAAFLCQCPLHAILLLAVAGVGRTLTLPINCGLARLQGGARNVSLQMQGYKEVLHLINGLGLAFYAGDILAGVFLWPK